MPDDEPAATPNVSAVVRRAWPWVAIVVGKLWLVDGQRLTAYGSLTIDDQWFVERAASIRAGTWLGPFAADTLIKQPGYPMFVTAVDALGVPLLLAQHLVYIAAAALVVAALRHVLPGRRAQLVMFAIVVGNPMTMNTPVAARVDRAGVYPALTLVLLAGLVGAVDRIGRPGRACVGWAALAGAASASLWLVREEWLLVVPAIAAALVAAVVGFIRRRDITIRDRVVAVAVVTLVVAPTFAAWLGLRAVNDAEYGLAVANIQQTSMAIGIGAMLRVEPLTSFEHFPVTRETRAVLYDVSPTLRALAGEIEGGGGARFQTLRPDGVRDLGGQVLMWVVLDAVAATGRDGSADEVDRVFRRIADEIDDACARGVLECSGSHRGIAPAWAWQRTGDLAWRSAEALWRSVDFGAFSARSSAGDGTAAERAEFRRVTNEPLADGTEERFGRLRVRMIGGARWVYRGVIVAGLARGAQLAWVAWRARRRPPAAVTTLVVVGGLLVAVRSIGLAYLDLTTFPAFSPTYLAASTAVAVVLAAAAIATLVGRDA